MRLALCNEVIRDLPFREQCAFAAEVGYDGLEIAPFTLSAEPHRLDAAAVREVRAALADAGVVASGLHWLLVTPEGLSITDPDDAMRARTVEVMRGLVGLAAELGAAYLVHGSPAQRALPEGEDGGARGRAVACFAAAAEAAEAAGVVYCIEPLSRRETNFINTVAEAAAIVREVGSPGLRDDDRHLGDGAGRRRSGGGARRMVGERADRPRAGERSEPAGAGRRRSAADAVSRRAAAARL